MGVYGSLHQLQGHLNGAGLACTVTEVMQHGWPHSRALGQQEVVVMPSPLSFSPLGVSSHLITKFGAALGLRAVEDADEPVSIQALCTCSLGSEPDKQVTVR